MRAQVLGQPGGLTTVLGRPAAGLDTNGRNVRLCRRHDWLGFGPGLRHLADRATHPGQDVSLVNIVGGIGLPFPPCTAD